MNKEIFGQIEKITSRDELAVFVATFRSSVKDPGWSNRDLASFLEAMSAWIAEMDGYFENQGQPCPDQPSWKTIAQILVASAMYD